jgi:hypothetical protein
MLSAIIEDFANKTSTATQGIPMMGYFMVIEILSPVPAIRVPLQHH